MRTRTIRGLGVTVVCCLLLGQACGCGLLGNQGGPTPEPTVPATPAPTAVPTPMPTPTPEPTLDPMTLPEGHAPDAIRARGVLRVGMRAYGCSWFQKPTAWDESGAATAFDTAGRWYGWECAYASQLAQDLGVTLEPVVFSTMEEMLSALSTGTVDAVMSGLLIGGVPGDYVVTAGYNLWGKADLAVYVRQADAARPAKDMQKFRFGVRTGLPYADAVTAAFPNATVTAYADADACFAALAADEIDAVADSAGSMAFYSAAYPDAALSAVTVADTSAGKGIYLMAGNDALCAWFNEEIGLYPDAAQGWCLDAKALAEKWGVAY